MYVKYTIEDNRPVIHVHSATSSYTDSSFEPYFYIAKSDFERAKRVLSSEELKRFIKRIENEGVIKSYPDYKPLLRVVVWIPPNVPVVRDSLHGAGITTFDSDVFFNWRYLIDKGLHPTQIINIIYLDIEVKVPDDKSFPLPSEAPEPVICISVIDVKSSRKITLYWRDDLHPAYDSKPINGFTKIIYQFNSEEELFKFFLKLWRELNPEVVIGWNVNGFDLYYLYTRLEKLGLGGDKLSPFNGVMVDDYRLDIGGIYSYDLLQAWRNFKNYTFYPSLEFAAKEEGLEKGKVEINKCWVEDIKKLVWYNMNDAELCLVINDKYMLVQSDLVWHNLGISEGVPLDDALVTSKLAHFILAKYAHSHNFALPTRPRTKSYKKIRGALVFKPVPGVHKDVAVYDFKNMYPSLVKLFNIGFDTKVGPDKHYNEVETLELDGVRFYKPSVRRTIIADLIDQLVDIRGRLRKEMALVFERDKAYTEEYKTIFRKQEKVKFFTNAFSYGIMNYPGFFLYDSEVAQVIPAAGRQFINLVLHYISGEEVDVILDGNTYRFKLDLVNKQWICLLGDTDSLFISIAGLEDAKKLHKIINDFVRKYIEEVYKLDSSLVVVELDKIFLKLLLTQAKKRYAGYVCWENGTEVNNIFKYVGFELKRQNTPYFVVDFQERILKMRLDGKSEEEILEYVGGVEKAVYKVCEDGPAGKDFNIIGIKTNLSKPLYKYKKNPAIVSAVKYSNSPCLKFNIKEKQRFYYTKFLHVPPDYPFPPKGWAAWTDNNQLPEGFIPDEKYIVRIWINNIVNRIFSDLDMLAVKTLYDYVDLESNLP